MADADLVLSVNSSHDAMTALENALPGAARRARCGPTSTPPARG